MIIGTITLLSVLLFGGSNAEFEYLLLANGDKILKEVVVDKKDQKALLNTLKPMRKRVMEYKTSIVESLKNVNSLSIDFEDKTGDIKIEFESVMKDFKAAESEISDARITIAGIMSEEDWELLKQRIREEVEYREIPDIEASIQANLDAMEKIVEETISDEDRKKRIMEAIEQFRASLNVTIEQLIIMSPSSHEVFRDQKAGKLDLEKAYYPLNKSLTDTFNDAVFLYSKARAMSIQTEWTALIAAYKSKAKKK
jgi:hypothetical protein